MLPVPPSDDEKFRYVRRNAWILTLVSVASFPLLLFSQTRLMLEYHWFWVYIPFVVIGALFLALPMLTDGLSRRFDFDEHQRLVKHGGRTPIRRWTYSFRCAGSQWTCSAIPGNTWRR